MILPEPHSMTEQQTEALRELVLACDLDRMDAWILTLAFDMVEPDSVEQTFLRIVREIGDARIEHYWLHERCDCRDGLN